MRELYRNREWSEEDFNPFADNHTSVAYATLHVLMDIREALHALLAESAVSVDDLRR